MPPCYIADLWACKMKGVKERKGRARELFFKFHSQVVWHQPADRSRFEKKN